MQPDKRIPVSGPSITQKEIDYVLDAVEHGWYEEANKYHTKFENRFAEYIGTKYAISLPSCTSAIHLALLSLGIGPGDEVIVPDITWIATSAPISYVGATPVFADIDPKSWCLSAESFEMNITDKTRAVIPVALYGNMPDMDAIRRIASKYKIAVIEDAAEAIGSEYKDRKAGSLGDAGVFSFHGSKTMTTGEGGMLVTNREDIYERSLILRDHGRHPGEITYWNHDVAYKYKMSSMQAALGLAQLERIDELVARKLEIFSWYADELAEVPGITLNDEGAEVKNTYWMVTIIVDPEYGINKEKLMELLSDENIDTRPFFHPLSSIPAYQSFAHVKEARQRNVQSYTIAPFGINLPSGLNMTEELVRHVCKVLKSILKVH